MNRVSVWMARWIIAPIVVLIFFGTVALLWATDRAPPFAVIDVAPAVAHAGGTVNLRVDVRRDVRRTCDATFTRAVYDGAGYRFDLEGMQTANAAAIRRIEQLTPGAMRLSVPVPLAAMPGAGALVTSLEYTCNPLHQVWPIRVVTVIPFQIEAARP